MDITIDKTKYRRGELCGIIRRMKPCDTVRFPISKLENVRTIVYNRLHAEKSRGAKWSVSADWLQGRAVVKRNETEMINEDKIMLENILAVFETKKFSRSQAASIVGGRERLNTLIADGSIECDKPSGSQNGKWYCNAAQCLRHCRNMRY